MRFSCAVVAFCVCVWCNKFLCVAPGCRQPMIAAYFKVLLIFWRGRRGQLIYKNNFVDSNYFRDILYFWIAVKRKQLACQYASVEHVWNVMAHAQKPDLGFQRNGRVHLNWRRVQSTTGSWGVRISGSNAGYTMFWGRVQDYWLPTPLECFPYNSPTVRRRVP